MGTVWNVLLLCGMHCYTCYTYMHVKGFFSCKINVSIRLYFSSEPGCIKL